MNPTPAPSESAPPPRLHSLDALRGFDMAFIVGFGALCEAVAAAFPGDTAKAVAAQFDHVDWLGFHFEDLIFPMFVFIAGVSLTFSLARGVAQHGRGPTAFRFIRRCVVLFAIGIIYSGGFRHGWDAEALKQVRWLGVLQRIALASLGAGLLHLFLRPRWLVVSVFVLLGGYWALFAFLGNGDYAVGTNIANAFDAKWLPGRQYDGHDPEGILSTLPAIASALLGVLAGLWMQGSASPGRKTWLLFLAGAALLTVGWVWSPWDPQTPMDHLPMWQMPVIKKIWTSSFVLVAGGCSAILFALSYLFIDVLGWRALAKPWVWIGCNPITIYLCESLLKFESLATRFTGPREALPITFRWLPPAVAFCFVLLLARFLYQRKVFIRV